MSIRKLAAIDIALPGSAVILVEYAVGVVGSLALGIFVLLRARSAWGVLLALHLLSLGVNHVPLLLHAASLGPRARARAEVADELIADRRRAMRRCRRGSLLPLLPSFVPVLALVQARRPRVRPSPCDGGRCTSGRRRRDARCISSPTLGPAPHQRQLSGPKG